MTKIPWTNETWNPVVGCTKIAPGCKNCYAERMAKRLYHMGMAELWKFPEYMKFEEGWKNGHIELCEHRLEKPLHWRKPRMIFVCSMSDLFHEKVPFEFIEKVIGVIEQCPQHDFQILTKRPRRMLEYFNGLGKLFEISCCPNLWLGTSISTQADAEKNIPILLQIPAAVRFVSVEPMLEAPNLEEYLVDENDKPVDKLHWLIIGCESGPKARLCSLRDMEWMVEQGKFSKTPVFVKQIPIDGKCNKNPEEWPADLRVQEYPENK